MRKERKHYTAEEKVAVLRRHLLDKVPLSDLCEELSLKPTVLYRWEKSCLRTKRVHSAGNTALAGRRASSGGGLRRALQQHPLEQCHRLYHAKGYAGRRQQEIHSERDRKLAAARQQRHLRRQQGP